LRVLLFTLWLAHQQTARDQESSDVIISPALLSPENNDFDCNPAQPGVHCADAKGQE
jgi:hypothetical protein